jgi:hypothetical protein
MMDYWNGNQNKAIRYYFYSQRGLALFNEFRYLFMLIFGVYFALKLSNIFWFVLMFLVSIPVLCFFGWLSVHKIAKVIDWLNVEYSTHWSKYGYELQETQNNLLRKILDKLDSLPRL